MRRLYNNIPNSPYLESDTAYFSEYEIQNNTFGSALENSGTFSICSSDFDLTLLNIVVDTRSIPKKAARRRKKKSHLYKETCIIKTTKGTR